MASISVSSSTLSIVAFMHPLKCGQPGVSSDSITVPFRETRNLVVVPRLVADDEILTPSAQDDTFGMAAVGAALSSPRRRRAAPWLAHSFPAPGPSYRRTAAKVRSVVHPALPVAPPRIEVVAGPPPVPKTLRRQPELGGARSAAETWRSIARW